MLGSILSVLRWIRGDGVSFKDSCTSHTDEEIKCIAQQFDEQILKGA